MPANLNPNIFSAASKLWSVLNGRGFLAAAGATAYQMRQDALVLMRPSTLATVFIQQPGTIVCDIGTAGPTINGRDQVAAFDSDSLIYFYWIWNGTTLATIASASPPIDAAGAFVGPTMPQSYTHWSYLGCSYILFGGTSPACDINANESIFRSDYSIGTVSLAGAGSTSSTFAYGTGGGTGFGRPFPFHAGMLHMKADVSVSGTVAQTSCNYFLESPQTGGGRVTTSRQGRVLNPVAGSVSAAITDHFDIPVPYQYGVFTDMNFTGRVTNSANVAQGTAVFSLLGFTDTFYRG